MDFLAECTISPDLLDCTIDAFLAQDLKAREDIKMLDKDMMKELLPEMAVVRHLPKHQQVVERCEQSLGESPSLASPSMTLPGLHLGKLRRNPLLSSMGGKAFAWTRQLWQDLPRS